jgi:hypothetical protein
MARKQDLTPATPLQNAHARFGWTLLFVALLFGVVLEGLHGFKAVTLLMDPVRRELWQLAHFHGALLGVVNLVYVHWADSDALAPTRRRPASRSLMLGSALLPLGFFLGGISHHESDPGIGILVAPPGAVAILFAVGVHGLAAWKR